MNCLDFEFYSFISFLSHHHAKKRSPSHISNTCTVGVDPSKAKFLTDMYESWHSRCFSPVLNYGPYYNIHSCLIELNYTTGGSLYGLSWKYAPKPLPVSKMYQIPINSTIQADCFRWLVYKEEINIESWGRRIGKLVLKPSSPLLCVFLYNNIEHECCGSVPFRWCDGVLHLILGSVPLGQHSGVLLLFPWEPGWHWILLQTFHPLHLLPSISSLSLHPPFHARTQGGWQVKVRCLF